MWNPYRPWILILHGVSFFPELLSKSRSDLFYSGLGRIDEVLVLLLFENISMLPLRGLAIFWYLKSAPFPKETYLLFPDFKNLSTQPESGSLIKLCRNWFVFLSYSCLYPTRVSVLFLIKDSLPTLAEIEDGTSSFSIYSFLELLESLLLCIRRVLYYLVRGLVIKELEFLSVSDIFFSGW